MTTAYSVPDTKLSLQRGHDLEYRYSARDVAKSGRLSGRLEKRRCGATRRNSLSETHKLRNRH
jgi:hypothetical protein